MSDNSSSSPDRSSSKNAQSIVSELCRMLWMVFGPVGIFFSGVTLWKSSPWTYSFVDGVYWGIVLLTVTAKFLHTKVFHGMTTDDKPATMPNFWQYTAKLVVFAAAWWWFSQSRQM